MIALRPARGDEVAALWALRTRAVAHGCAGHYAQDVLDVWLASPAPDSLSHLIAAGGATVAEEAGRMLGYAAVDVVSGEVDAVFVEPGEHGRGIGRMLLAAAEDMARAAGCRRLFLSASLNAVPFYQRAGFIALREALYPHRSGIGIPSVYMEKQTTQA
ncbi:GNAT family N-acetyltransferase [Massilia sp. YIM B02769]|jgi:putative acetyltransferase|uniref:GNAT family N-acetyltransferase n=1 Tax=unclassified Massilia TaxID=2609279 RepID=UPI0025B6A1F2|nr:MULTISPECIES: GNAT family N-acetyltransferase [unclassified Massilia]MDN4060636.1 GNAT family N-acetyltransferase [Massilia sp. YIM B02769]